MGVASQRKQLSNHAPDRAYIRHWLADNDQDVAEHGYARQGALHKSIASRQRVVFVQLGSSAARSVRDDMEQDPEAKTKRWARTEQFSEHLPARSSDVVGK